MTEQQTKPNNHWMLRDIAKVYEKYSITDEEDPLVSTWGMNEDEAKAQIIANSTPERAIELLKASEELKAIVNVFIEDMKTQLNSISAEQPKHSILRHSSLTDVIQQVSNKDFYTLNRDTKQKTPKKKINKNGYEIKIKDLEKISNGYGASTKKLWTYISWIITNTQDGVTTFSLPWINYAEKNQIDVNDPKALANFKDEIYDNLCNLYETSITIDGMDTRVITAKTTRGAETDCFRIDVHERIVKQLKESAILYLDNSLYALNNKSANAFSIAFKLSIHFYNENNIKAKTNTVLSVDKLLQYAPEIRSLEEYHESGQRTWKRDLKKPLEKALDDIVDVGFLKSWDYRVSKGKSKISREDVEALTLAEYEKLMITFTLKNVSKDAINKLTHKE